MQPDISLVYNNQEKNDASQFGYGWSLSIPYIERTNKFGVEKLYSVPTFYSSIDGELATTTNSSHFVPRVDSGDYRWYTYFGNVWKITDTEGNSYYFGQNASARLSDAQNSTRTHRWYLERIEDTLGNSVDYSYEFIEGNVYPKSITYTNHSSLKGIYEIQFTRSPREDVITSYATGFAVTTKYRISEIKVLVQGVLAREYDLRYGTGINGTRTLLEGITEIGYEADVATTLPEVQFTYQKQPQQLLVQNTVQEPSPKPFTLVEFLVSRKDSPIKGVKKVEDKAARLADVNADGYPDVVYSGYIDKDDQIPGSGVYLNTGYGFALSSVFRDPWQFITWQDYDNGVRLGDLNADGFADILQARRYTQKSKIHIASSTALAGVNGWGNVQNFKMPTMFIDSADMIADKIQRGEADTQTQLVDVNGDNLPDVVSENGIYINNGSDWVHNPQFVLPRPLRDSAKRDGGVRFVDVNNDGLNDIVYSEGSQERTTNSLVDPEVSMSRLVYVNTGTGTWIPDEGMIPPVHIAVYKYTGSAVSNVRLDYAPQFFDFNGDGLTDVVYTDIWPKKGDRLAGVQSRILTTKLLIGKNTAQGIRWQSVDTWLPEYQTIERTDWGARFIDMNGDGRIDLFQAAEQEQYYSNQTNKASPRNLLYENAALFQDSLVKVLDARGLETSVTYDSVKKLGAKGVIPHPKLQWPIDVVAKIEEKDTIAGSVFTTSYTYENGISRRDGPFERRFAGFEKVTEKIPHRTIVYYFHQGNETNSTLGETTDEYAKIGKVFRQEVFSATGQKITQTLTGWTSYRNGNRTMVLPTQEIVMDFDGDSTAASKAFSYTYNQQNGNIEKYTEWGRVVGSENGTFTDLYGSGAGADKYVTSYTYAFNPQLGLYAVNSIIRTDANNKIVGEQKVSYDGGSFGTVSVGLPTRKEFRIDAQTFASSTATYGPRGMLSTVTDVRGNTTRYVTDATDLFYTTVTNPLNQRTLSTYDYSSGKPLQILDSMNVATRYTYDGFDRVRDTYVSGGSLSATVLAERTTYDDSRTNPRIITLNYLDDTARIFQISYKDAFGQEIQHRMYNESNTGMIVRDTGYSWPSLVSYRSMPYAGSGLNRTSAQANEALITRYRYDALNRVVSEVNVMGETTYAYNDWTTTVTDTQKGGKKLYYDAYGNMTRIDEFSPNHYDITWYGYDGNKNLTGIADALGNERYFTYDLLGRRITAEDLHAKNDTTFGKYSFTYDAAGNVLTVTDPENTRRTFVYDALGRITSDDSILTPNVEAIYTYDWCGSWGKGRLCSVNAQGVITNYTYDTRGRIVQESRTIPGSSVAYTTITTYDIQNNPVTISYPNSAKVFYKYNNIGKVENVQLQASASAAVQNLVANYDYHVSGAPLREELASGVITHYTYDANELYRLRNRKVNKGTALYEDVTYTYDKVGNITRISDTAPTLARRTVDYVYDGYYRITSAKTTAVNGAITTENFAYNKIGNIVSGGAGAYLYEGATSVAAGTAFANPHAPTKIANAALAYDKKGNVLTYSNQTYTWDHANRLTRIVDTGTSGTPGTATPRTINYLYDHASQRVRKVSGTTTTLYPNKYFEVEGEIVIMYVWANDQIVSAVTKNNTSNSTEYIHKDHLGSTKVITDVSGNILSLFNYTPFGEELILKNNSSVDRHFIGERFDEETQMSYLNARYLQNKRGQFLSQDPVFIDLGVDKRTTQALHDPQLMNSYSYARNNPMVNKDPGGEWVHIAIGAGAGILGQYSYDVYNNVQNEGFSVKTLVSNLSSGKTYLTRAAQGGIIAATGGAVAAAGSSVGIGAVGQSVIMGGVTGVVGAGGNAFLGEPVRLGSVALDSVVGALTFGASSMVWKTPGRLPGFGTDAFFFGKHTQQSAMNLGVDTGTNYISAIMNDISKQIKDQQKYINDLKKQYNSNTKKKNK